MLANEIELFNLKPEEIVRTPSDENLVASIKRFGNALEAHGINVRLFSEASLRKLPDLGPEKKIQTAEYFKNASAWIEPSPPFSNGDLKAELAALHHALDFYGLKASDEFLQTIKSGDVIEIYGANVIQLYRSLSFYEKTGYSLLDLSVFEWFVLWERPTVILERVGQKVQEVLSEFVAVKDFSLPKHVLREIQNTGNTEPFVPRACVMEFKNIGSLTAGIGTKPQGLICTSRGEVIAMGQEAEKIQFV